MGSKLTTKAGAVLGSGHICSTMASRSAMSVGRLRSVSSPPSVCDLPVVSLLLACKLHVRLACTATFPGERTMSSRIEAKHAQLAAALPRHRLG